MSPLYPFLQESAVLSLLKGESNNVVYIFLDTMTNTPFKVIFLFSQNVILEDVHLITPVKTLEVILITLLRPLILCDRVEATYSLKK